MISEELAAATAKPRYMRSARVLNAERTAIKEIVDRLYIIEDPIAQRDATVSLSNIVEDSEFVRSAVIEHGGIAGLVALLSSEHHEPTSEARRYATRALTSLCLGGYPDRLMDPVDVKYQIGQVLCAIPLVVAGLLDFEITTKPTAEEQLMCAVSAGLIAALADGSAANQLGFAAAGALAPLVAMLGSPGQSFIGINLPTHAASALAALSEHPFLQGTIATHGAIGPLCNNLALGMPATREQCAIALFRLLRDNLYNKKSLLRMGGGVDALIGLLISGESRDSGFYAGRALVHVATKHPEGADVVYRRLCHVLFCCPNAIDFSVPGHPALLRRKLAASRILPTVATLASIPFEPLRACLVYELTPLPPGEHATGEFDELESESESSESEGEDGGARKAARRKLTVRQQQQLELPERPSRTFSPASPPQP